MNSSMIIWCLGPESNRYGLVAPRILSPNRGICLNPRFRSFLQRKHKVNSQFKFGRDRGNGAVLIPMSAAGPPKSTKFVCKHIERMGFAFSKNEPTKPEAWCPVLVTRNSRKDGGKSKSRPRIILCKRELAARANPEPQE